MSRDVTGEKFGNLTIISHNISTGELRCQCDCGRIEVYSRRLIHRYVACSYCRGMDCLICKKRIPQSSPQKKTCSDECKRKHTQQSQLKRYHEITKQSDAYVEYRKSYNAKLKERRKTDPEYQKKVRTRERLAHQKKRQYYLEHPEEHEKYLAYLRELWRSGKRDRLLPGRRLKQRLNREKINAENRAYYAASSEEQKTRNNERARLWVENLRDDPEAYNEYKLRMRENAALRRLEQQTSKLAQELEKLASRD